MLRTTGETLGLRMLIWEPGASQAVIKVTEISEVIGKHVERKGNQHMGLGPKEHLPLRPGPRGPQSRPRRGRRDRWEISTVMPVSQGKAEFQKGADFYFWYR